MYDCFIAECPFCGSRADEIKGYGGIYLYECSNHKCGAIVSFNNDHANLEKDHAIGRLVARSYWNTRTSFRGGNNNG